MRYVRLSIGSTNGIVALNLPALHHVPLPVGSNRDIRCHVPSLSHDGGVCSSQTADETRPACIRCQKRGLPCDGPKEHTFVNITQDRPEVPPEGNSHVIRFSSPSPQLCLTAFYDELCLEYTRKLILNGGPAQLACDLAYSRRSRLEDDPGMRLLQDAINSLAVTFFGSQHHQKAIEAKGYQRYGKVLARLNHHLSTTELQTSDLTIMSAFICVLVESFLPTGPLSFLAHLRGLEAILELRGVPKAPVPRDTLVILHGLRTLSIVGGLVGW